MPLSITADNPRVYLPSRRSKITFILVGGAQIAFGSFHAIIFTINGGFRGNRSDFMLPFVLAICFWTIGLIIIHGASKLSVVLSSNSIRVRTLYRSTTLRFGEILGKRSRAGRYSIHTLLMPKDKIHPKIVIKGSFGIVFDDAYTTWLASIPDLDAIDREKRRAAGRLHIWEE
jgi:hypothetical protein